jgi:acyl transferase domain-containing protein/acyl carrier protein
MSNQDYAALLKDALHEIRRLRLELEKKGPRSPEPIAILSMACRFPGAQSPEELWTNARSGVDCIQPIPADRWDRLAHFDPDPDVAGKMICTSGGFLNDVRRFDASFFGISPREAKLLDPQQRLLLELSWEALERAAIVPQDLFASKVGVFLGLSNLEYASVIRQSGDLNVVNSYYGTGNAASVTAGRLAYYFGFQGPAFVVDTACSSSLVAMHLAVSSLRRDECSLAIVGGVNLMLLPETFVHFSNGRMLSSDGRCKPFSASADGYGRSEGCGIVVLKRLQDAVRDRDPIVAIIRGSAINHDGRSAGLTAPNGPSQEAVIQASLQDADRKASDIQFVEAHGTGTPLGDPIEAGAIARVYGSSRTSTNPLMISTVKANIGHAESAAGIAGVIHASLCLQHAEIPPLLHMKQRSPHVPWESLQFATDVCPLKNDFGPVCCGVSSFGFSGTNGHLILEQYQPALMDTEASQHVGNDQPDVSRLLVLSAKTPASLRDTVARFIELLESGCQKNWEDICYTLQVGRTHFAQRVAVVASNQFEAASMLREFLADRTQWGLYSKTVALEANEQFRESQTERDLAATAASYVSGASIDWNIQSRPSVARRICLPTYAFQGEEFWVSTTHKKPTRSVVPSPARQTYVETWKVSEPDMLSISEHQLFGASVMPGVGWIHFISASAFKHFGDRFEIRSLQFDKMYLLPANKPLYLHVQLKGDPQEGFDFHVDASSEEQASSFESSYVSGKIQVGIETAWQGGNLVDHRNECVDAIDARVLYDQLESLGFGYGPSFQKLKQIVVHNASALGQIEGHQILDLSNRLGAMVGLHDSTLHTIAGATMMNHYLPQDATAFIPVAIDKLRWFNVDAVPAWSKAVLRKTSTEYGLEADIFVWSIDEKPSLQILGIKLEGFSIEKPKPMAAASSTPSTSTVESNMTSASLVSIKEPERSTKLQEYLREHLARELEIPASSLKAEQPLAELGLDSLMIFRMGIQLESEFGFVMDTKVWMDGLSLQQLTKALIETVERRAQLSAGASKP